MLIVLAFIMAILLLVSLPVWPHSASWSYYPSTGIGLVLVVIVIYLILRQ